MLQGSWVAKPKTLSKEYFGTMHNEKSLRRSASEKNWCTKELVMIIMMITDYFVQWIFRCSELSSPADSEIEMKKIPTILFNYFKAELL